MLRKYALVRGFVTVLNFGQYRLSSYVGSPLLRDTGWPRLILSKYYWVIRFIEFFMNGKSRHVPLDRIQTSQNYIWMFVFRTFAKSGKVRRAWLSDFRESLSDWPSPRPRDSITFGFGTMDPVAIPYGGHGTGPDGRRHNRATDITDDRNL